MADKDREFVYVDVNGVEVAKDDPAVQTRYTRADFKALDKAMLFGARPVAATADGDVADAKGADPADAAAGDDGADAAAGAAPVAAKTAHPKK